MIKNKQLAINMIAQIIGFLVNVSINFFLTPYIVNNVGSEAYGFLGLANNFANYAAVLTVALNSMASRFISISIHQNDEVGASKYFSSIVIVNFVVAVLMIFPSIFLVLNLEKMINISLEILLDVKLLWGFILFNFIISLISGTYGVATFVTNKLYLSSIAGIISQIVKVIILLVLFIGFVPSMWYVGLATFFSTLIILISNIHFTNTLLPKIKVNRHYFDLKSIYEVVSSGIWNTWTRLSQILTSQLDLLIANLFISSAAMGVLAVSKTIPTAVITLIGTIAAVFAPSMTIAYAKGDIRNLVNQINQSMKIMTIFSVIPNAILFCFGSAFYALWVPKEDTNLIHILSILAVINSVITGVINPLYSVFTITNKVKVDSIVMIIYGCITTSIVFILLKYTDLGLYAIAGTGMIFSFILTFVFHMPYAARCLNLPWYSFYRGAFKSILSFVILASTGTIIINNIEITTWISLILNICVFTFISAVVLYFILLSANEQKFLLSKIRKFKRKGV